MPQPGETYRELNGNIDDRPSIALEDGIDSLKQHIREKGYEEDIIIPQSKNNEEW
jgi:hypothetical protein